MKSTTEELPRVNGYPGTKTIIGRVTTTETETHRINYETASWYTLVEVPAGTYEVYLLERQGMTWAMVGYHGTITDEHFVNRIGASSSLAKPQHIGEPKSCTAQRYCYSVADSFANDPRFELAEDWSTGFTTYQSDHDGSERRLYHLIDSDGNIRR